MPDWLLIGLSVAASFAGAWKIGDWLITRRRK